MKKDLDEQFYQERTVSQHFFITGKLGAIAVGGLVSIRFLVGAEQQLLEGNPSKAVIAAGIGIFTLVTPFACAWLFKDKEKSNRRKDVFL